MKRLRRPRQSFERLFFFKITSKQHIHQLLRRDPTLSSRQLAEAAGCTTAYARIWRRNFFSSLHELAEVEGALGAEQAPPPPLQVSSAKVDPLSQALH